MKADSRSKRVGAAVAPGDDSTVVSMTRRLIAMPEVARLVRRLGDGRSARTGGLLGGSPALLLGAVGSALPDRPFLIVTPDPDAAADLAIDLRLFLPAPSRLFPVNERRGRSAAAAATEPDAIAAERLLVLEGLARREVQAVVAPVHALLQPVPAPDDLAAGALTLTHGDDLGPDALTGRLADAGLERVPIVEFPGQFARRGGIVDFCPPTGDGPFRIEFFGDEIDSIRVFEPDTQRSAERLETIAVTLTTARRAGTATLADHLPDGAVVALVEPASIRARAEEAQVLLGAEGLHLPYREILEPLAARDCPTLEVSSLPPPPGDASFRFRVRSVEDVTGDLPDIARSIRRRLDDGHEVIVLCTTEAERERFGEILADRQLAGVSTATAPLSRGFSLPDLATTVLTNREIFHRYQDRREARRLPTGKSAEAFWDLKPGDLVVHFTHGIGRFDQIVRMKKRGKWQEYLVVEYRDRAKVYVPASRIDTVQKYVGAKGIRPRLSALGGSLWAKKKADVAAAVEEFSQELLEVQAARQAAEGLRLPDDDEWQREFEASFPFPDTPDQAEASIAIKQDMTASRPMDRLICGDVGYGKTELAVRAAFKAATAGYQVVVLVPTTVLAEQHFRTFSERMADYPVTVEVLSRFRSKKQQREILERLARGDVDVLIGTHRVLSPDVVFPNLGLMIVDEEQRFGVKHKEALKRLRRVVDILTLTATPIPRTLHMALLGIRDISSLATPPRDRLSIQTRIARYEERLIREAILREKARGGQTFFVHNRVQSIDRMEQRLQRVIPEASFAVVHGQMNESTLEERMVRFLRGEVDVLVTTTIIESGLDLPNVNTLLVNMADRFGLADLHQLRGRVGRYRNRAYAYFLLPERGPILPQAEKRLRALEEFSELGAGFQIAMRDLEIRGAGNILGPQQSGHIATVGYDLYCRLMTQAVARRRDQAYVEPPDVDVLVDIDAYIPDDYVPHQGVRFQIYRKFATAISRDDLDELRDELGDRFGAPPPPVEGLFLISGLRLAAGPLSIFALVRQDEGIEIRHRDPDRLADLAGRLSLPLHELDERAAVLAYDGESEPTESVCRKLLAALLERGR